VWGRSSEDHFREPKTSRTDWVLLNITFGIVMLALSRQSGCRGGGVAVLAKTAAMILVAVYFRILEAMTRITGTMAIMGAIMVVVMMAGGLGILVGMVGIDQRSRCARWEQAARPG